ncbi:MULTISPECIES: MFS transporter [Rhodococcus]|uniref:Major facilitator superfamily (MFS) profile domain-containing protein n=1 Tax=Rhodococcus qingshengii TaxID=334542 RepID=A0A2A5J945_RHOSG|nr:MULTISPECIES: MFS transporter [Rhodococcus]MDJ0105229.1 MFS transporter [Rhodococcus erythropolis]MDV8015309.1 MFS transporter [Rhodococcus sp. IEGM 1241]PCK25749.1 hypothetical protein CHR55_18515 [Rhodococcus qingshengii]
MSAATPSWESVAPLPRGRLLRYSVGKVGSGLYNSIPGLLLMYYLTDTLAVTAAVAGIVVVIPKIWDMFCATLVGNLSDRDAIRHGRRTRLMLLGTVSLPVLFVLIFSGPSSGWQAITWVLLAYILAALAFEMFDIPYLALPAEMSASPQQRTRIMGWRIIATTVGVLMAGGVAPILVSSAGGGRRGYIVMALVMAVLMFVVMLICTLSSRWVTPLAHNGEQPTLLQTLRIARQNRPFVLLMGVYLPHAVGISMIQTAMAYVTAYLLGNAGLMALLFVALMGPSIFTVPLWTKLAHRVGKSRTFTIATVLYAVTCIAMFPAVLSGNLGAVVCIAVIMGIAFAGEQVMVFAMVPDTILADTERTGHNRAGAFAGVMQSLETTAAAIGAWTFSLILVATGFLSSTSGTSVEQTSLALNGIAYGYTLIPAVLLLATLPLIRKYSRSDAAAIGDRVDTEPFSEAVLTNAPV